MIVGTVIHQQCTSLLPGLKFEMIESENKVLGSQHSVSERFNNPTFLFFIFYHLFYHLLFPAYPLQFEKSIIKIQSNLCHFVIGGFFQMIFFKGQYYCIFSGFLFHLSWFFGKLLEMDLGLSWRLNCWRKFLFAIYLCLALFRLIYFGI